MPDEPLKIVIQGDNRPWKRAVDQAIADAARLDATMSQSYQRRTQMEARLHLLSAQNRAASAAERRKDAAAELTAMSARDRAAQKSHQAELAMIRERTRSLADYRKELESMGGVASQGIADPLSGAFGKSIVMKTMMGEAAVFAHAIAQSFSDAFEHQQKIVKGFIETRDRLRNLATVRGETADSAFTERHLAFAAATGLPDAEAMAYREAVAGSGVEHRGTRITEGGFDKSETAVAKLAVAKGLSPTEMGDLVGRTFGMKDRSKMTDDEAAKDVLGTVHRSMEILSRGVGSTATLGKAVARTLSTLGDEDKLKGVFTSVEEASKAVSIAAEAGESRASETVADSVRGTRAFDDKTSGPFLKKAGVTPTDTFFTALPKIRDAVEEERKASPEGTKTTDILAKHFSLEGTRRGLAVMINRGLEGGLFKDRDDLAASLPGSSEAEALIAKAERNPDEAVKGRKAKAATALAEARNARPKAPLEAMREEARKEIEASGDNESFWPILNRTLLGYTSFGINEPKRILEDRKVSEKMRERAKGLPVILPEKSSSMEGFDAWEMPTEATARLMEWAKMIKDAGGDPWNDAEPKAGSDRDPDDAGMAPFKPFIPRLPKVGARGAPDVPMPAPGGEGPMSSADWGGATTGFGGGLVRAIGGATSGFADAKTSDVVARLDKLIALVAPRDRGAPPMIPAGLPGSFVNLGRGSWDDPARLM